MPAKRITQRVGVCLAALSLHLAINASVSAQAWLPAKGEGSVAVTYANEYVRNHVFNNGQRSPNLGRIRTNVIVTSLEYGITDRLALNADTAFIASKYIGTTPHGPDDDGSYRPSFQDMRLELRYNALRKESWVVTPFIGATIPTHDYEVRGHSAIGRGFNELLLGVSVGRQLEVISSNAYAQGRYSYAILGRYHGLSLNRSNAECEVGWVASKRLTLRFIGAFQKTHGGIITPFEPHVGSHEREFHDRITRSHLIDLGGGTSFSVNRSFSIHAAYLTNVYARNHHAHGGMVLGVSWNFSSGLGFTQTSDNSLLRPRPTLVQTAH